MPEEPQQNPSTPTAPTQETPPQNKNTSFSDFLHLASESCTKIASDIGKNILESETVKTLGACLEDKLCGILELPMTAKDNKMFAALNPIGFLCGEFMKKMTEQPSDKTDPGQKEIIDLLKEIKGLLEKSPSKENAETLGNKIGELSKSKGLDKVVEKAGVEFNNQFKDKDKGIDAPAKSDSPDNKAKNSEVLKNGEASKQANKNEKEPRTFAGTLKKYQEALKEPANPFKDSVGMCAAKLLCKYGKIGQQIKGISAIKDGTTDKLVPKDAVATIARGKDTPAPMLGKIGKSLGSSNLLPEQGAKAPMLKEIGKSKSSKDLLGKSNLKSEQRTSTTFAQSIKKSLSNSTLGQAAKGLEKVGKMVRAKSAPALGRGH